MAKLAPIASRSQLDDQAFFVRTALVIVGVTAIGFGQFSARGFAQPLTAPWWVHLHAVLMVAWLALFVIQNRLAASGKLELHRELGRAGALLVPAIAWSGTFTAIRAIELHRTPPIFSPAYFLALTMLQMTIFTTLVVVAVSLRRKMQYHRRLMLGATIVITASPGFGRLLTIQSLTGEQRAGIVLAYALLLLGLVAMHDRKTLGRTHPATLISMAAITAAQLLPGAASHLNSVQTAAARLAA